MNAHLRLFSLTLLCCAGCSNGLKPYEPEGTTERKLYMPSLRTAAPEPVYRRVRWVHLPEVLPDRELPYDSVNTYAQHGIALRPVFHLSLKDVSLEEAGRVLAAMARYTSYTAPSIASKKISIDNLGTIDELAELIERKAEVQVVLDHENKEVRMLAPAAEEPQLFSE